jgi:hypothetical protein
VVCSAAINAATALPERSFPTRYGMLVDCPPRKIAAAIETIAMPTYNTGRVSACRQYSTANRAMIAKRTKSQAIISRRRSSRSASEPPTSPNNANGKNSSA